MLCCNVGHIFWPTELALKLIVLRDCVVSAFTIVRDQDNSEALRDDDDDKDTFFGLTKL